MHLRRLLALIFTVALSLLVVLSAMAPGEALAEPLRPAAARLDAQGFPPMNTEGLEHLESARFQVYATPAAVPGFSKILARAEAYRDRIQADLGSTDDKPIRVVVIEDLNDYFARRDRPAGAPPWAVGLAVGREDTILIKWGKSDHGPWVDMDKTFVHELAHVALDRKVGEVGDHAHGDDRVTTVDQGGRRVPRWFHEGFAIAQAGEWTLERGEILMEASLGGNIISLHDLRERFPAEGFLVELAYAESYNFILYLDEHFGRTQRIEMLNRMADGQTFEDAFFGAYKRDFGRVEKDWYDHMNVAYTWFPVGLASSLAWFLGGAVLVLAWARKRRETRARMDALDDDDDTVEVPAIPLPGLGLTDAHVRGKGHRVFSDGSWMAADGEAHALMAEAPREEEVDELLGELDELRHLDDVPRTPDGHTLH